MIGQSQKYGLMGLSSRFNRNLVVARNSLKISGTFTKINELKIAAATSPRLRSLAMTFFSGSLCDLEVDEGGCRHGGDGDLDIDTTAFGG